jgi:hypothetical protein
VAEVHFNFRSKKFGSRAISNQRPLYLLRSTDSTTEGNFCDLATPKSIIVNKVIAVFFIQNILFRTIYFKICSIFYLSGNILKFVYIYIKWEIGITKNFINIREIRGGK